VPSPSLDLAVVFIASQLRRSYGCLLDGGGGYTEGPDVVEGARCAASPEDIERAATRDKCVTCENGEKESMRNQALKKSGDDALLVVCDPLRFPLLPTQPRLQKQFAYHGEKLNRHS